MLEGGTNMGLNPKCKTAFMTAEQMNLYTAGTVIGPGIASK